MRHITTYGGQSADILSELLTSARFSAEPLQRRGQTDIGFPVWASKKLVVTPSLSVVHVSNFATDVGFVLAVRVIHGGDKAVPYYGVRAGALHQSPHEGKALTDYLVGGTFGGECSLQDHFSVGVEAQVNVVFSDEHSYLFGNPYGTNINTAAAVMAYLLFLSAVE